jgi:hypothetical protein
MHFCSTKMARKQSSLLFLFGSFMQTHKKGRIKADESEMEADRLRATAKAAAAGEGI